MSSAYKRYCAAADDDDEKHNDKLLTQIKNTRAPRMEPCGTPMLMIFV